MWEKSCTSIPCSLLHQSVRLTNRAATFPDYYNKPLPMSMASLPRRKCNNNNLWKCINTNVWQNSKSEPNRIRNFCRYRICLVYYPRPSQKTESKMFPDTNESETFSNHIPYCSFQTNLFNRIRMSVSYKFLFQKMHFLKVGSGLKFGVPVHLAVH